MNVKQFKRRFLHGMIEPELFYFPVSKKEVKEDVFSFKISIPESSVGQSLHILSTQSNWHFNPYDKVEVDGVLQTNLNTYGNNYPLINLRTKDGVHITKKDFTELFWDRPYNVVHSHFNSEDIEDDYLSENMIIPSPNTLKIDWGDGTSSIYSPHSNTWTQSLTIMKNNVLYDFLYDDIYIPDNMSCHTYKEVGEYIITVSGDWFIHPCVSYGYYSYDSSNHQYSMQFQDFEDYNKRERGFYLVDIYNWGNLKSRSMQGMYVRALRDMEHLPPVLPSSNNVIDLSECFNANPTYNSKGVALWEDTKLLYSQKITFQDIGDNFFSKFPNISNIKNCFSSSNISYIPSYCFSQNKYLTTINNSFNNCPLEYIGEYAFANCTHICDGNMFRYDVPDWEERDISYFQQYSLAKYIGKSAFENCENIRDVPVLYGFGSATGINSAYVCGWEMVYDKAFKNCKEMNGFRQVHYSNTWNTTCYFLNTKYLGDELFSGCESLKGGTLFDNAPNLQYIGNNMFKGCKNLIPYYMFANCILKKKLPDNLFYDMEFTQTNSSSYRDSYYRFTVTFDSGCPHYEPIYIPENISEDAKKYYVGMNDSRIKDSISRFLVLSGGYSNIVDYFSQGLPSLNALYGEMLDKWDKTYRTLHSDLYDYLYKEIHSGNFENITGFIFGKNMFSPKFLKDLVSSDNDYFQWNGMGSGASFLYVYYNATENEYGNINRGTPTLVNRYGGECPEIWKYNDGTRQALIVGANPYGNSPYNVTPLLYDNASDIPNSYMWLADK